ncbi:MAG: prepilin-type N-terminal cleavage/methylation domain-containing protein, partial [Methanobrevibacter sp.]|nr:prepilin-type N-terminal cleavage/methylation domain-containing protein [Methanobrevibacter sp.]
MKKGFTLIELLGVMVLLGLLGLITAPVILNAIEDSKKNTFSFAANTILHQIDEYYEEQKAEFGFNYEGEFLDISNEFVQKRLKFPESTINQGDVYISSDGEIAMYITDGNWCASKGNETNKVIIDKGNSCFVDNVLKKEFVDLMDKDYHSFKVSIVSPKNQNFTKYEFQVNGGEWIDNGSNKEYSHTVSKAGIYTVKSRLTNSSNVMTETYITNILVEPIKAPVF